VKKKVLIVGKLDDYAVQYINNCREMKYWANEIKQCGYLVYVPCLLDAMGSSYPGWGYADYLEHSRALIPFMDMLFVVPDSEDSDGTKIELEDARKIGTPVYHSIEQLKTEHPPGEHPLLTTKHRIP